VKYCDKHVRLSLRSLAYLRNHTANFTNILCMLTVIKARSSSGIITMHYVQTEVFSHNWPYGALCVFLSGERIE